MTNAKAEAKPKGPDNNKRLAELEAAEEARKNAKPDEAGSDDPASNSIARHNV